MATAYHPFLFAAFGATKPVTHKTPPHLGKAVLCSRPPDINLSSLLSLLFPSHALRPPQRPLFKHSAVKEVWALTLLHTAGKWTTLSFHSILSSFHFSPTVDEQRGNFDTLIETWTANRGSLFELGKQTGCRFYPPGHRWLRLSAEAHLICWCNLQTRHGLPCLKVHDSHLISVSKCHTNREAKMHDWVWSGVGHACEGTGHVQACLYGISEMMICICSRRENMWNLDSRPLLLNVSIVPVAGFQSHPPSDEKTEIEICPSTWEFW